MKTIKKYFFRDIPSTIGTVISLGILLFMIIGPFATKYDPLTVDMGAKLVKPGRDVYKRQVLVEGTKEEIEDRVRQIIEENGKTGFILGADCTIPTEIEYWRVRAAAEAARK